MDFGEKLLNLRKLNNMSQENLAEQLDISRQTISKWEAGQSTPDMEKLLQLTLIFDVSMDYLAKVGAVDELTIRTTKLEKEQKEIMKKQKSNAIKRFAITSTIAIYMMALVIYSVLHFYFEVSNPVIVIGEFVFATAVILLLNLKYITNYEKTSMNENF